ncbi:MAG: tetratricopeptide repeat protein [Candidatus Competibacteraceae bacterium]|nr:tetratricopeptide repeat protein [Candidatus Competibacteraceae bacterium]
MNNALNLILKTIVLLAGLFGLVLVLQKQLLSLEIVAYVGLVGIYPLTYLAYLGFGAQAQQKRLRDDFRLLGLAREEELEETVAKLYRTVYNPFQFVVYIALIVLESLLILWGYQHCKPSAVPCFDFVGPQAMQLVFYSYLGAFVFSVQELIRRYNTFDLQPQVYSSILVRILIAAAITFAGASFILSGGEQGSGATDTAGDPQVWAQVLAFSIGIFPTQGIRWLVQQADRILNPTATPTSELPLREVLGISTWHEARLGQMGIDDAQNLATVDIRRLLLTTQFDTQEITNWIDQAILYVKVGARIQRFREVKIASCYELWAALSRLSTNAPLQLSDAERNERLEARKRLALALGMADADELERLADCTNFPNYSHIAEYYARSSMVARRRANLGMEILLGDIVESDPQRAIEDGERLLSQNPNNAELLNSLGSAYHRLGRLEEAFAAYTRAIELDDRLVEAYVRRSLVNIDEGRYQEAIRDCTDAINLARNHAQAFNNRGLAYMTIGYLDRALEDLDEALRLDDRLASAYLNRGVTYNAQNDFARALQDFERAYLLGHRVAELWLAWGIALIGTEQYQPAIEKLSRAVLCEVDLANTYAKRGYAYLQLNYYRQARNDLTIARDKDPRRFEAHHNLGLLEARLNNFPAAIDHYRKALAIAENQFVTRYNLALAYYRSGNIAEARAEFERVLAGASPDSMEARQARIQLSLPAGRSTSTPSGGEKTVEERQHDETDDRLASDQ